MNDFFDTVILTAAVFAALITSIVNVIISLINSHRLKKLEEKKQMQEIDKYRYTRLYELIMNWHKYDTKKKGKTVGEIAFHRLVNLFLDNSGRYEIAKPLLDKCYIEDLENKKNECNELLIAWIDTESPDGTHTKEYLTIRDKYFSSGEEFSKLLKNAINSQFESLLRKGDI